MKKWLVTNKRAKYDYALIEEFEAGVVLSGQEVKSLRLGRGSLADSHVVFLEREAFLVNMHITGYPFADLRDYEPTRSRKLLLRQAEVDSLEQKIKGTGMSLIPVGLYVSKRRIKVGLALARGKKEFEKRETIRQRDLAREVKRDEKLRVR